MAFLVHGQRGGDRWTNRITETRYMFSSVLSSISKFLWQSSSDGLVQLPSGELYVYRAKSGRATIHKECLFHDSTLTIVKAPNQRQFHYDLIVERVLDEDEPEPAENGSVIVFEVSDHLSFTRVTDAETGGIAFQWRSAHDSALHEWIPDKSVSAHTIQLFHYTMAQCLFERARGVSYTQASDKEIQAIMQGKQPAPKAPATPTTAAPSTPTTIVHQSPPVPFFVFDPSTGHFVSKDEYIVQASLIGHSDHAFSLVLTAQNENIVHKQPVQPTAIQHIDRPTRSFVWCLQSENPATFSLKFTDESDLFAFTNAYARCVYEVLNRESMKAMDKADVAYLTNPFLQDIDMKDASEEESEEEEISLPSGAKHSSTVQQSGKDKNRQLVVGYRYGRSFVSRGSSIGVFKTASSEEEDGLSFVTTIKGLETAEDHKPFSPSKLMLYDEDSSLLLMNPNDQQTVYRMDLEVGKVVDEWKVVEDHTKVTNIVPDRKYAAMTPTKTLIGMNNNSIFRIDPRLPGVKQVETETKQYVVKNDFTCGVTTGKGELAVASKKGDIRLFNKLDKRAKTLLPGFGDPILGLDVTEDGRYIVATCKTYLLFINTELSHGEDQDLVTGFTKPMPADNKPLPKRLTLKPEHVAYMTDGGASIGFTEAHFSTGSAEGRAIIASTGPYVITWPVKSIIKGKLYDYQIKKYGDTIVADNFKYGQDNNIIVTLPDQVTMIDKSVLQSPRSKKSFNDIVDSPF